MSADGAQSLIARVIQRLLRMAQEKARAEGNPRGLAVEAPDVVKRLPKTHQEAAQRLVAKSTLATVDYRNKVVKTSREGAHPQIVEFYVALNRELAKRGYPFYAFEFYRSNERQERVYANGASNARAGQSPHNWGCAVDVVHATEFWDIPTVAWKVIGAIGYEVARKRKIPIVWGGDWDGDGDYSDQTLWDPAHWELAHWRDLRREWREALDNGEELPDDDGQRFGYLEARAKARRQLNGN